MCHSKVRLYVAQELAGLLRSLDDDHVALSAFQEPHELRCLSIIESRLRCNFYICV